MPLGPNQQAIVAKASAAATAAALTRIATRLPGGHWLDVANVYVNDCIATIKTQTATNPPSINASELAEYIAASGPLHCMDGWSQLGRALDCHNRADRDGAIHLAYYAELRAAMALLATQGIGIFKDKNFVVTSTGGCELLNGTTHEIAWNILEYWAGLKDATDLIRRVIVPGGIQMGDWLDAYGALSVSRAIGKDWLRKWGIDLLRLSAGKDREARNQASYRPTRLIAVPEMRAVERSAYLRKLWLAGEPQAATRFAELDRHLLRITLDHAKLALGDSPRKVGIRLTWMLSRLIPNASIAAEWRKFLTRRVARRTPLIISDANSIATINDPRHHVQVLSRAALLLRLATGACQEFLKNAHIGRADLEFWWKPLGEIRGLWPKASPPSDFLDLWADVDLAAADLYEWERRNKKADHSSWRSAMSSQLNVLGECERIGLWGLGI